MEHNRAEAIKAQVEALCQDYRVLTGQHLMPVRNVSGDIKGYRNLPPDVVAAMNNVKEAEAKLAYTYHLVRTAPESDAYWLDKARTALSYGFMALVRALAQPVDPFAVQE